MTECAPRMHSTEWRSYSIYVLTEISDEKCLDESGPPRASDLQ